jgi:hypothetical protein
MNNEEQHAWDRQPGESSRAYRFFSEYRSMGPDRSLVKLRERAKAGGRSVSVRLLERWSAKMRWVMRSQRYDDYLEYQDRMQQEKERREMHKRHAKMGMLAQSFAVRKLEKLSNRIEQDEEHVSPGEVARILDVGVKVERLARGESTESHELSGPGGGPVKLDLAETLKRIDEIYGLKTEDGTGKTGGPGDGSGASES